MAKYKVTAFFRLVGAGEQFMLLSAYKVWQIIEAREKIFRLGSENLLFVFRIILDF